MKRSTRSLSRTHPGKAWFLAGYVGLAGFFAVEVLAREPGTASGLDAGKDDQGSTQMIVTAWLLAVTLSPLLRQVRVRPLHRAAAPLGLAMQATGLGLRVWSMRTLGGSYSRTLRTQGEQRIVDDGPYRFVRHPGYLGSLLTWTGFASTSGSLPVVAAILGLFGWVYGHRIHSEENLLRRDLPGYAEYCRGTKRLLPFVW